MSRRQTNKVLKSEETGNNDAEEAALLADSENMFEPDISVFRPDREGIRKVLGDLEADVMDYVWEKYDASKGISVREVYEQFRLERSIAYTTVMTTMARLAKKNLLTVRRLESTYMYSPKFSKAEFIDNFVARILENLLVSFADTTEVHLQRLGSATETTAKIEYLRSRLDKLQKERSPQGTSNHSDAKNSAKSREANF
jgi:predicted transcriptional regulator